MTDNTSSIPPAPVPARPGESAATPDVSTSQRAKPARGKRTGGTLITAFIIVVILAGALGAGLWAQRKQFMSSGREVAARLDQLTRDLTQSRNDTREALALAQAQAGKVAELETRVREAQSQAQTLQQALQNLNDGTSDEMLANDIERLVTIASQQLRLAGNVGNAIVALETAQGRLARADRPRFASLQQSLNGDLDRLRAVPTVDIPGQSARIERLVALVNRAPLLVPDAAAPNGTTDTPAAARVPVPAASAPALPADAVWWERWRAEITSWPGRAGSALAHELGDLISVQRADAPAALLLSPEQAEQVRSTLRQRLLTVQLSMLMRQSTVWKSELETVADTLSRYFDGRAADTQAALTLARDLAQTDIAVRVPDVADSLNNIAALRAAGFKTDDGQD
ncbi:uroporphyrinogen-III C-methyltransferase [Bordetella genomosp. 5]|uniref:Heme biosynthesis operon protein HemX n=1 Tax=Bordetella genomosp. 5 TaxID=1395608 RepID=A0A261TLG5_9BORD|nr:uroporphyrinogen-III C-methyltransferase [Bordetella genomosp. 5]OZI50131.1 heme biosynthesis operon protein HemX [Bordetella genomosp. 5]